MTISYQLAHSQLGTASDHICKCGKPALDWAYQHTLEEPLIWKGRPYSSDPKDYLGLEDVV